SLSMPDLGGPVVGRRRPAAVVTTDPAADLDGATAAMRLSPADLPPTHPSGPGTTAVMPKALVPGVGGPAPGDLEAEPTGSGRAGPPEALAATLGGWAGGLRDRARQLSALQRLAAAVAVIALLAAWQSSRSSWYDQVDAARAAAAGP